MRRHGLIVGIDRYRTLPQLSKSAADAESVAQILETSGEFKVTRLPEGLGADGRPQVDPVREVSTTTLKKAIADIFRPQGPDYPDLALLFFAGHGISEHIGLQEVYLAASDSDSNAERWGVPLSWLQRLLINSPIRSQVVWLDCCHSGELLNLSAADPGGMNRCFIAASRSFEAAYEQPEDDGHGVLTSALLKGLNPALQPDGRVTHFSLADTINRALCRETQHPVCNNSGEPIVLTRAVNPANVTPVRADICPYKGLEFFDCNDIDPAFFYGRDVLVDQLLDKLRTGNFAAVTGISGSGKSSMVRAGLLHQLKRGQRLAGSDSWTLAVMLPGEHPLESLVETFRSQSTVRVGDLGELLASGASDSLSRIVNAIADDSRLILVVDQFEEVFTRCYDETERERFLSCLLEQLDKPANRLTLIIVLRADFFSKCAERSYSGLARRIQNGLSTLLPMSVAELRAVIVEPARKVGLDVDGDLVAEIIAAVHREPGDLPLLEYTLTELWKRCRWTGRLSRREYLRLGGVQGALKRRADAVFQALTPEEREAAKWIFIELTQLGEGTEDTRRRLPKEALIATQRSPAITDSTLEKLTEARLLVKGESRQAMHTIGVQLDLVDVAHESLIRSWPRLRRWVDENRAFQRWRLRLRESASEWATKADDGLLLRGARLLEAEAYLAEYRNALSRIEIDFITAGGDQRRDEERAREAQLQALDDQRNRALRVQSLFLSDLARQQNDRHDHCLGLLLALEALPAHFAKASRPFVPQAYKELYKSAVNLQRVQILRGPTGAWIDAAFSPDGRRLVTTHNDGSSLVWDLATGQLLTRLAGHAEAVNRALFSPDGRRLATSSFDNTARLWSTDGWKPVAVLDEHDFAVNACAFSPDSRRLLTAASDQTARLWESETGDISAVLVGHDAEVFSAAFSPDGRFIATASKDRTVRLWDPLSAKPWAILGGHDDSVFSIAFGPDGKHLASASGDGTARLWDLERGMELQLFKGHHDAVNLVAFSPQGHRIATASQDGTARLWEIGLRKSAAVLSGHEGSVVDTRFSADGRFLLTAGQDGTTRLWEAERGELMAVLPGARGRVNAATFDPSDRRVASVSQDGSGRIWNLIERERLEILWGHQSGVYSVAFHPGGNRIATGSQDRTALLWDLATGAVLMNLKGHGSSVYAVAFSPDGQRLVTASRDGTAAIWDVENGNRLTVLEGHETSVFTAAYSPDGRAIVTASYDGTARVWDAQNGTQLASLSGHHGGVNAAAFSPDNQTIVTASQEGKVRLWKLGERPICSMLKAHHSGVNSAVFSPNGRLLATVSNDGTSRIWDLAQQQTIAELKGHRGVVYSAAFSPDGERFVTASSDQTARLWDTELGEELGTFAGHTDSVNAVAFSPDGNRVVTASHDRTVRVWRALPAGQQLLDFSRRITPRTLTQEERQRFFIE